jgi:hypothetical protein
MLGEDRVDALCPVAGRKSTARILGGHDMIDTVREDYPRDMVRAATAPAMGTLECMAHDVLDHVKDYARSNPAAFGLWALGIGFVLGWKLKPW